MPAGSSTTPHGREKSMKCRLRLFILRAPILAIIALPGIPGAAADEASEAAPRPNIIWIMADDMGYGDAGCYGQNKILTPTIDRLASEGMRFTNCYAGSTVCAPSRSVLMTGLHTGHTTVRGNFGREGGVRGLGGGRGRVPLRDSDLTVAEVLKQAGYSTALAGKWGLGEPETTGEPRRQGFDRFFGFLNQRRAHNHYPDYLWLNEDRFDLPGNSRTQNPSQYAHDLFSSFALNFIRSAADGPFFLYLSYTVPHAAFQVPDFGPYESRDWPDRHKAYAAMITRMDAHIGGLLELLDSLGISGNTLIFFCSDNGAADRYEGVFDSSGPLRGRKRDLYEGGLRTPMIVRWPDVINPGSVSDAPWYFGDFLPTAAALAGANPPARLDGMDISPLFRGGDIPALNQRTMYWEFHEGGFNQAARHGKWKAVKSAPDDPIQLFDLENDPGESRNITSLHPEVAAGLETFLREARKPSREFPSPID